MHKQHIKNIILIALLSLFLVGCSTKRPEALPKAYANELPWGAIDLDINSDKPYSIKHSLGSVFTKKSNKYNKTKKPIPLDILTLTGGGSRGAFGTGLIVGWAHRGDMPKFNIITGISTGAVMAPFVFAGGEDLKKIEAFYTKSHTKDVFQSSWLDFFSRGNIMNAEPLKKLFKKNFDKEFLDKIAAEHKKGRRLYIGTTNMDTGQLVVWDMGAIASSNRPDKYDRFSEIIYASSALPVYLPPQYMKVEVEGKDYYQMHVDGGIYSQVFMIGLFINWTEVLNFNENANTNFDVTLYTIANRKYRQRDRYEPSEQAPFDIIEAYVLIEMDLLFDRSLYRLYQSCIQKDINFKMATIPDKMKPIIVDPTEFNPDEMIQLFNMGYSMGIDGIDWTTEVSLDEYDNNKFISK